MRRHTYKEHVIHLTTTRFGVYWEVWDGEERRGYGYTCRKDPLEHPRRFVDRIATDDASAPALADHPRGIRIPRPRGRGRCHLVSRPRRRIETAD